jgi:hypothetical protein
MPNRTEAGGAKATPDSHRETTVTAPVLDSTGHSVRYPDGWRSIRITFDLAILRQLSENASEKPSRALQPIHVSGARLLTNLWPKLECATPYVQGGKDHYSFPPPGISGPMTEVLIEHGQVESP